MAKGNAPCCSGGILLRGGVRDIFGALFVMQGV